MRPAPNPRLHLFVCANRRVGSPLGPGCGDAGDAVYDALKQEVSTRGLIAQVWITKTQCLGICPKRGATVARYGAGDNPNLARSPIVTEVEPTDSSVLLAEEPAAGADDLLNSDAIDREIADLEELQRNKVLDLARRLKPGLTMEDVQNPHDFPELDDPDWHYADGVLTGIASVKTALAALRARSKKDGV